MARQQFDHQIRNTLEKREINPSAGSWEQLSKRLDSAEKKRTPVFWWAGIAASIVGGILILSMVFNNSEIDAPGVADNPSEEVETKKEYNAGGKTIIASEDIKEGEIEDETKKSSEEENMAKPIKTLKTTDKRSLIASEEMKASKAIEQNVEATSEKIEHDLVQSKLQEIIAEVSSRAGENADATDAEIDALLQKAAAEISRQQSRDGVAGAINANDLLFDVEMELEQSFREKVFDILKEGYTKAKTAVANRTN